MKYSNNQLINEFEQINPKLLTQEICNRAFKLNAHNSTYIPNKFITDKMVLKIGKRGVQSMIDYIEIMPKKYKTLSFFYKVADIDVTHVFAFPKKFHTVKMIQKFLKNVKNHSYMSLDQNFKGFIPVLKKNPKLLIEFYNKNYKLFYLDEKLFIKNLELIDKKIIKSMDTDFLFDLYHPLTCPLPKKAKEYMQLNHKDFKDIIEFSDRARG